MRRMIRKTLVSACIGMLFFSQIKESVIAQEYVSSNQEKTGVKNGKYIYPKLPQSISSHKDMAEFYQIPITVLNQMSTKVLFKTVVEYPLNWDFLMYDTPEMAVSEIRKQFNGLDELLKRSDLQKTIMELYLNSDIPQKTNADYSSIDTNNLDSSVTKFLKNENNVKKLKQDISAIVENLLQETILAQDKTYQKLNTAERKQVTEESIKKEVEKGDSKLYEGQNSAFLQTVLFDENNNDWKEDIQSNYLINISTQGISLEKKLVSSSNKIMVQNKNKLIRKSANNTNFVYTPKKTKVFYIEKADNHYNSKITEASVKSACNGQGKLINRGYSGNNCHAYAWARRTDIWIQPSEASKYVNDGSYKKVSGNRPTANNQRIVIGDFKHSGIVTNYSKEDPIIVSKLGGGAIAECPASALPYNGTISYYKSTVKGVC